MPHYSEKKDLFPMTGGCPCGATRYTLSLPPLLVHVCHCTTCQHQTGGGFALNAFVESSAVTIYPPSPSETSGGVLPAFAHLTGATTTTTTPDEATPLRKVCLPSGSGMGQTRVSCPRCHTTLYSHYADAGPHAVYLLVGTLDRAAEIEPDAHIFVGSKKGFLNVCDGKPQFDGYYENRGAVYREDVKERVRALDGMIEVYKGKIMEAMKEANVG